MNSKSALLVQRWMLQPRVLLVLILLQFIIQFFTSVYLYKYVTNVEGDLRRVKSQYPEAMAIPRRRRSSALPTSEDNAVSDLSSRVCMCRVHTVRENKNILKNKRTRRKFPILPEAKILNSLTEETALKNFKFFFA